MLWCWGRTISLIVLQERRRLVKAKFHLARLDSTRLWNLGFTVLRGVQTFRPVEREMGGGSGETVACDWLVGGV